MEVWPSIKDKMNYVQKGAYLDDEHHGLERIDPMDRKDICDFQLVKYFLSFPTDLKCVVLFSHYFLGTVSYG